MDLSPIDRVHVYANHPDLSTEIMQRASLASPTLLHDVEAMKRVAPTQRQLEEAEQTVREIQRTPETRMRWQASMSSLCAVVKHWLELTRERVECMEQQSELMGECALVGMLIVFGAEKQQEECETMATAAFPDHRWVSYLSNKLYHGITDRAVLNGDLEKRYPGNMNLSFANVEGESLLMALKNIVVVNC
ncbi:hypothetical protein BBJ28_00017216 [Nothophytophthora sp. Chile5]|nr:hypothetical protein BBJ28_00017216 [Nothophytophthora sp. Chile5]